MTSLLEKIRSPAWRLHNLYKITDKQSRLRLFEPNAVQQLIHASPAKRKRVLKARQFGITTDAVLRRFDSCIWNQNKTVAILAHEQKALDKIFGIVKTAYESMPEALKPVLDRGGGSKYEYRFPEINSRIYTALEVRGGTIHELHVSEAAFIKKSRLDATLQAVPLDGLVEFETTANGLNHFYDAWGETEDGYARFFFPWFFHGEYRIPVSVPLKLTDEEERLVASAAATYGIVITHEQFAFRRHKIRELGPRVFQQEYPEDDQTCFLSSGSNPFDTARLKARMEEARGEFTVVDEIRIYEPLQKNRTYVIGADPAEGVRSDNSAASCFCVETQKEVASFASNTVDPGAFAEKLHRMGELYARVGIWPQLIVERNNHGHAVLLKLNEVLCYPHLWVAPDEKLGHPMTTITRPLLIDTFVEAVQSGFAEIRTRETLGECLTLVDNNGKIEAEEGKKDDRVVATALAIKLLLERLPKVNIYENIATRILV